MTRTIYHIGIVLLFSFFACKNIADIGNLEIDTNNAEYAIPLFNTTLSFEDIITDFSEETFITIEEDGLIRFNYKGNILESTSQQIFDQIATATTIPLFVTDTVVTTEYGIPDGVDIDFADMKSGTIAFTFTASYNEEIDVQIIIDEIEKDGEPYIRNFTYDGSSSNPFISLLPIAGWRWNSEDNQLTVRYKATLPDGTRILLDNFIIALNNLEFSYAEGYLGNEFYPVGRDTINIDFFDNWIRGNIYFEDPKITLTAFNSFGFPLDGKFNQVKIITVDSTVLPVESPFIEDGVFMNYPSLAEVGQVKETVFSFNKDNSNIREVLGSNPIALDYDLDGETNPELNTNIRGFMTDSSFLRVQVEVELPIHGAASGFGVLDTFEVDFSEFVGVKSAEFKVISENKMPLDVGRQLYFLNENDEVIDSLLTPDQLLITAAPVDQLGNVNGIGEKTLFIPIPENRLDPILAAKRIALAVDFSTYNEGQESVRITAEQSVNVRVGVRFQRE